MNRFASFSMWFTALLLSALVAGCGGDDDDSPGPTAAGTACSTTGTEPCVDLATAGDFAILATTGIANVAPSSITGNVGLNAGAGITGLTCAEMKNGKVIDGDGGFAEDACETEDPAKLSTALTDIGAAFVDAAGRPATATVPVGAIPPGVYDLGSVTVDTDITLDGPATGVWIFKLTGDLALTTGSVLLTGGAAAQNVFWRVAGDVNVAGGETLPGVVMSDGTITLGAGAVANGRLYADNVSLNANTVTRP